MTRALARLGAGRADVLIVGGGIHGLFAALDAARRGLRVVLIERQDVGSGLSFNHQRTIHGGLRALQRAALPAVRDQIRERRAWAALVPHFVRPLPFLVGTYGLGMRSRLTLGVGLRIYDVLGRDRNRGLPEALHLPASGVISRAEAAEAFPGIRLQGLTGGARWYDYQLRHPDRVNGLVAAAAVAAGVELFTYVECLAPLRRGARVRGARVRVWPTGEERDVEADAVLLCAGAGLADLHARFDLRGAPPLLRAMNLVLERPPLGCAVAASGRSGRMLTCVPWNGASLVGTDQSTAPVAGPEATPPGEAVAAMLEDVRTAFPHLDADAAAICVIHHGLTPAVVVGGRAELLPESTVLDQGDVLSLVGVKFTTARQAAATAVDRLCARLARGRAPAARLEPLPGGTLDRADPALDAALRRHGSDVDPDVLAHLLDWYGDEAARVLECAVTRRLTARLAPGRPFIAGEIAWACETAGALRLADVVLRRTRMGSTGHPGQPALEAAADVMAGLHGWDAGRRAEEIAEVERRFVIPAL